MSISTVQPSNHHSYVVTKPGRGTQMIAKFVVGAAIVFSSLVGAAPAGAEPNSSGTEPNPFSSLTCDCQQMAPAPNPAEIERGILSAVAR